MDDKLIRLARKVKTLEDELNKISKIKDLDGLLLANSDMSSRYRKSIAETVNAYKDYISNTKKELQDSLKAIQKEQTEKHTANKKNIDSLEAKLNKVKDDILNVSTSINKSIEDIQKDILKDIKDKNNQILLNLDKKDKELKEVKKENTALNKDLKALKDLVGKLELQKGDDGKSAYDIACELGFKGTKEEWIKSLHGKDGQDIELRGLRAFSDVKNDNKMYARKNKKWVEVEEYDDTEIRNEIEALQTENTRLKATLPTTTGSGENITLSKTAELEFIQPPLPRGNSEQVQYSGKNLLKNLESTQTINGITFTVNEDGSIICNGTATANALVTIYGEWNGTTIYQALNSNKTYTISGTNNSNIQIFIRTTDGNALTSHNIETSPTFTGQIGIVNYFIQVLSGSTLNNEIIKPMLEEGSTATAYEPYVGGTASPNPSYPQEITNVTGDVEVLVQNKNLVDYNKFVTNLEHTITDNELIVNFTGTFQDGGTQDIKIDNKKYIVSYEKEVTGTDTARLELRLLKDNVIIDTRVVSTTSVIDNENGLYDTARITLSNRQTTLGQVIFKNIQLEQGTTATAYTPHKKQTYTFPLGTQRLMLGDYLADDGIHHGEIYSRLTVNDNWIKNGTRYELDLDGYSDGLHSIICTHFTQASNWTEHTSSVNNTIILYKATSWDKTRISINTNDFSTLAEFKQFLNDNSVYAEYELAEEEITPYTTEQQQAYNEIKQALSYEEQTNISGSSDEANPIFSVEAYQSMKLVLAG
ncbi:MAG: hypothetical protein IKF17_05750 [Clostridia bacterium]|nr:hypothetical protein [Clostridia bacterium]